MYRLFSNPSNLEAVFASFGTIEAVKVKCNIDLVARRLKIPSRALLEQMRQEGISLTDIDEATKAETDWSLMSETVLRSHLRAAFLDEAKLYNALATLSLSQQAELRDMFTSAASHLKLPSELLLKRMQDEGLGLEKFGVNAAIVETVQKFDKLDKVRDKLNALVPQAPTPISKTALNPNLKADLNAEDSIASLKQRINQLKNQPVAVTDEISRGSANVVALANLQTRLKA